MKKQDMQIDYEINGLSIRQLADKYNMSKSAVGRIVKENGWAVDDDPAREEIMRVIGKWFKLSRKSTQKAYEMYRACMANPALRAKLAEIEAKKSISLQTAWRFCCPDLAAAEDSRKKAREAAKEAAKPQGIDLLDPDFQLPKLSKSN